MSTETSVHPTRLGSFVMLAAMQGIPGRRPLPVDEPLDDDDRDDAWADALPSPAQRAAAFVHGPTWHR